MGSVRGHEHPGHGERVAGRAVGRRRPLHLHLVAVGRARGRGARGRARQAAPIPNGRAGNYSRSKAAAELLALASNAPGFAVVALRPHLIWGPGDTQLIGRIVERARQRRLAIVGSGAALVDTTYIDNAADAIVAAVDRAGALGGRAFVVSNGEPRPVQELFARVAVAAGCAPPRVHIPKRVAWAGGRLLEHIWSRLHHEGDPPLTSFLAEQLSTAHWFDQRETRAALRWEPAVGLDEGFARLHAWLRGGVIFDEFDRRPRGR